MNAETREFALRTLREMYRIHFFETMLLEEFGKGTLRGTSHTSLGQEAIAVGALMQLDDEDFVVSNHRCHGHYLAIGGDPKKLLLEISGSFGGVSRGVGGSQHLQGSNFLSNGILGGMVPIAAGIAYAKRRQNSGLVVCFLGDGMLGEGVVYETFNMASLYKLPIVFVIEKNGVAQSTEIRNSTAGSIAARPEAFGIETMSVDGNDIYQVHRVFERAMAASRAGEGPQCVVADTYRLGPHSKGDDTRDEGELRYQSRMAPIARAAAQTSKEIQVAAEKSAFDEINQVFSETLLKNELVPDSSTHLAHYGERKTGSLVGTFHSTRIRVVEHLNSVLQDLMVKDSSVVLLGEDLADPYGGAFKVSLGLSSKHPEQVISTPISEAAIVGLAIGMSREGFQPIVEIMFGDFVTLAFDQIVNHATKFDQMYGLEPNCPLVIRSPMGGYRGYGPTHSQSLEKLFFGVTGLTVIACDPIHTQAPIWNAMFERKSPFLYIENKSMYGEYCVPVQHGRALGFSVTSLQGQDFPVSYLDIAELPPEAVIFCYGGMVSTALDAAREIFVSTETPVRVVVVAKISPVSESAVLEVLDGCRSVVVLEEGGLQHGWGASIGGILLERLDEPVKFRRVAALDSVIPVSSSGESRVLPDRKDCVSAVREVLHGL